MESVDSYITLNIWPLVNLTIAGLLLYLALSLGNRIVSASSGKNARLKKLAATWPLIERSFWAIFLLLLLGAFVKSNPIVGSAIAGILVISLWSFLRNFLSGLVLQYGRTYHLGQSIRLDGVEGTISQMGAFACELSLSQGTQDKMKIPYSQLTESRVTQTSPSANTVSGAIELTVPKSVTPLDAERRIRKALYNNAWLIKEDKHAVELLPETETEHTFRVAVNGIDTKHLLKAKAQLSNIEFGNA